MALTARTQLGPFEIVGPLGAGGMGEVYRARDQRLDREVAIKVLPASYSADPQRLRRFEQEARAAAALNHPNILAVYDIGTANSAPYIVSELLDGETLRARLQPGPLSVRKAIELALQIARGLAAAHDKGIVHRDLKPDNIFITRDGQVKILDFGLAKLTRPEPAADGHTLTLGPNSEVGTVVGTAGYMSPEQVRGKPTDARSDLFTFGAILYEMVAGRRAFHGESAADIMSAIVRDDPPDLTATNRNVPPALEHIVRHCLEKSPEERFQSARDIAFDLELVSQASGSGAAPARASVRTRRALWAPLLAVALAVAALGAGYWLGHRENSAPPPPYHQLTFRRGYLSSARFAPDGQSIVYTAAWEGNPRQIYSARVDSRNSLPLGLENAELLAISSRGEVAVLTGVHTVVGWSRSGTLARTGLTGGTPRPVLENVSDMAWTPDGKDLAVIRYGNQHYWLEYPVGKVLVETSGWLSDPVFLPGGDAIAYAEHPQLGDDRGSLAITDLQGHSRKLAGDFPSIQGIAWHPLRKEIWFTASDSGIVTALRAATLSGRTRVLNRAPGRLQLQDIAADGRILLTQMSGRRGITIAVGGQVTNADAALLDWSVPRALSADQQSLLFSEQGDGGGPQYSLYLRRIGSDGDVVRLSDGDGSAISPDGKWALGFPPGGEAYLIPIGAGERRRVPLPGLRLEFGRFTPDGKSLILTAVDSSHKYGIYLFDLSTNAVKPVTPPGYSGDLISPDGNSVLAFDGEKTWLFPISGGTPREVPAIDKESTPQAWAADGKTIFATSLNMVPLRVYRVNLTTGERTLFREFAPPDRSGIVRIDPGPGLFSPDGHTTVFGFVRLLSDLYVMDTTQ